jgi:hypothetical protein
MAATNACGIAGAGLTTTGVEGASAWTFTGLKKSGLADDMPSFSPVPMPAAETADSFTTDTGLDASR